MPLPVWLATRSAAARIGAARMAIQPFDHAGLERHGLGLLSGLSAIELGNTGTFVVESLPILSSQLVLIGAKEGDDSPLVTPNRFMDGVWGLSRRIQDQIGARSNQGRDGN